MMVVLTKGFKLRHIGHLDCMRAVQRALRRSGLPVVYSKGFNPHIELSFASPLSLGVVGLREVADIPLARDVSEDDFTRTLNQHLPGGMFTAQSRLIGDDFPTLMALVSASRYAIVLPANEQSQAVVDKVPEFLALSEYLAKRKTKAGEKWCDIRPFIKEASVFRDNENWRIESLFLTKTQGSIKPSLWLKALCSLANTPEVPCIVFREAILCQTPDGTLIPMEEYGRAE